MQGLSPIVVLLNQEETFGKLTKIMKKKNYNIDGTYDWKWFFVVYEERKRKRDQREDCEGLR